MTKKFACQVAASLLLAISGASFIPLALKKATYTSFRCNPKTTTIQLYWKDSKGEIIGNFDQLQKMAEGSGSKLLFAMNGGMFTTDYKPVGLYIENGKQATPINLRNGHGNFHMEPNGIFYIDDKKLAHVCTSNAYPGNRNVQYATQSGPMLLVDGKIHPAFTKGSSNTNIRNGVGILPNNQVLLAISNEPVNFYDFAEYFKEAGCRDALYLDGVISGAYVAGKDGINRQGKFGVLVGVAEK